MLREPFSSCGRQKRSFYVKFDRITVSLEEVYSGHERRTTDEVESAASGKLFQCKTHEEDSAVAYGEIVVDKNMLISSIK
jgi:hypothetical protein